MKPLRIIGRSCIAFVRDDGMMLAGSMSYFMMMALVPFCLFIVTVFGYFLGHYPEFYRFFVNKVSSFFPAVTSDVTRDVAQLITFRGIGGFSVMLYGLLSYQAFASMEHAMNVIFRIRRKRNVLLSMLMSLLVVTMIMALLITSFAAVSLVKFLRSYGTFFPALTISAATKFFIQFVLPFLLVLFSALVLYLLLPRRKIAFRHAFWGALFTTVLLEAAKHFFAWYVSTIGQFGKIYGPLTAMVLFLLWMFYSSSIFLIGAEIVHALVGNDRQT